MPATRNRVTEPEEVRGALKFNEALTWRAGKSIGVGELLRRLQSLSQELKSLDQEDADKESIKPIAKDLASHLLLAHKDRGVKAWTACCIVDVFRLCAPDAPYTTTQLKDIFHLLVLSIIPALADPSNPYNAQHLFVLKSLTEVKSILLLTDIPDSEELALGLFAGCFDVLSSSSKTATGEQLSKNVEHHMTSMLVTFVDDSGSLPTEVVDVILAQFLRADPRVVSGGGAKLKMQDAGEGRQSTLLLKEAPPAYNMAKNVCNASADTMARHFSQYFSAVIVDSTTAKNVAPPQRSSRREVTEDDLSDDEAKGPSEEDMKDTRKAHGMIRELWRATPGVLEFIIPQLELELGAENVHIRLLATETLGDMIAGIGAAGPPSPVPLNPAQYPSQSLSGASTGTKTYDFLSTPTSPVSFAVRHVQTYESFLSRRKDKSPLIRSAWVRGITRILATSAGGVGLEPDEEKRLLECLSSMLVDADEKVRLAAVSSFEVFDFNAIVQVVGSVGGVSEPGSVLSNLVDRVKDKKPAVRTESIDLLGKIWGVAAGAIAEQNDLIDSLLGQIASRIIEAYYVNDPEINVQIDRTIYESMIPINFPPIKAKASSTNGSSQHEESQKNVPQERSEAEIDKIRVERLLVLVRSLEQRARTVFFARQGQQTSFAKYMELFLRKSEEYNGGTSDQGAKHIAQVKSEIGKLIEFFAKNLPESIRPTDDLWSFAKKNDRRSYQLIRFACVPESDYRKVYKAIKECTKRVTEIKGLGQPLLNTLTPLIYRSSILLYNRSHVPSIIEFSRTDERGLGSTAHEILKEISTRTPAVFKAHVQELCKALESEAPTAKKTNTPGAVDDLKACAGFARRFPKELPQDRKFSQAMMNYVLYGTPPKAAKHAVTILMNSGEKKEMHARDLLKKCSHGFKYGSENYLSRLAALSQLMLLTTIEADEDVDPVIDIAIKEVLLQTRVTSEPSEPKWVEDPDEHLQAKMWALRLLVNRLRSLEPSGTVPAVAKPVYQLLNTLIEKKGELAKKSKSPAAHRARLRLLAAQLLVKLSRTRSLDSLLTNSAFNSLATVIQDELPEIRRAFVRTLIKNLGQFRLPSRFYTILFLLAFEPDQRTKESALNFLRSRSATLTERKDTTIETLLTRFIALLAHHPDFDTSTENLLDFARYTIFYLSAVATQDNIGLIYHAAQRVKSVADGIENSDSENLYVLSDLSQAVVRRFEEQKGWSMQAWPGKIKLPGGIFKPLPSHEAAQEIATKTFIGEDVVDRLDDVVRDAMRTKRKRAEAHSGSARKKSRSSVSGAAGGGGSTTLSVRQKAKTPKRPRRAPGSDNGDEDDSLPSAAAPSSESRRRSGRHASGGGKSYADLDDSEIDAMEED